MPAPSRKPPASAPPAAASRLKPRDGAILAVVLALALALIAHSGFRRGVELMPWPDGLEYAAAAVNLDAGIGPVLHFGGYSYPPRYTEGYPLILAAAYPLVGHDVARLVSASVALGMLAIVALYVLTLELFDRPSAIVAALVLASSPIFVTYSTLVLSDVPTLAVTLVAALALARATAAETEPIAPAAIPAHWAIFGLLGGFTVMIRPTNATLLAGLAVALAAVPVARGRANPVTSLIAFAAGFAPLPLWQARDNLVYLGGVFANGYRWWVPEVYGSFARTFNPAYLLGPTMPRNPYGNLPIYLLTLTGLDGLLNNPGAPRFYLYPFAAAAFAAIGLVATWRATANRIARRVTFFGLGFLVALLLIYLFYVFTDVAFVLPGCFILFALAGYGAARANRELARLWPKRRRSLAEHSLVVAAAILDLLLIIAIGAEVLTRLSAPPRQSEVVPALRALDSKIEPRAIVVSNVSLQFLALYIPAAGRDFVGLHSFDPGEDFTDYHLARLYAKRARGWRGPVPPVLFTGAGLVAATADSLAAAARAGRPVYLLLWTPPPDEYADLLRQELDRLSDRFSLDELAHAGPLILYRLTPR